MRNVSRAVLVTGAGGGIGRAVAHRLASRSTSRDVLVLTDSDEAALKDTTEALTGVKVLAVPTDVSDAGQVAALFAAIRDTGAALNQLVHAAGIHSVGSALDTSVDEWNRVLAVNATGTFLVVTAAARQMLETESDNRAIVVIGSNAAGVPRSAMPVYAASKAAAAALTRSLGLELAPRGIRCNTVCPGSTDTGMQRAFWGDDPERGLESVLQGDLAQFRVGIPLGKIASPDDIAATAAFLLSEDAGHITMQDIYVDGGASLRA
ncbi:SDR family oxidoreductase [Paenarthrobacter sp. NPDC089714]|uniref:SDR family oxidoreductase n=1 Tax=Paenarthrobacter sp. NPDC089714 TaxID=3364377 RepID=UPI003828E332